MKPHVFFSLLATTGAASRAHMRRFSLQFCDFLYQNEDVLNIFHINPRYFSLLIKKKKKIVLVSIFPLKDYTHILEMLFHGLVEIACKFYAFMS